MYLRVLQLGYGGYRPRAAPKRSGRDRMYSLGLHFDAKRVYISNSLSNFMAAST